MRAGYTPNFDAVAQKLYKYNHFPSYTSTQSIIYASKCIQPVLLNRQISTNSQESVSAFRAAQLFSLTRVEVMRPTANCVDSLWIFPLLGSPQVLSELKELPLYLAKATDVDSSVKLVHWWPLNPLCLPKWSAAARKVIQPSSATAERIFSLLLKATFSEQQQHGLNDYVETCIILQHNKH